MNSVLITGANRGLGLGMVKYLTENNKAQRIVATCRNASEDLKKLSESNGNLTVVHLDLLNTSSFDDFSVQVGKIVGDSGLNLLINNAGVTTKFAKLNLVKSEQLIDNLTINTVAPIMLTKSLLPLLKLAAQANDKKPMGVHRAAVINISSVLGSIAQNDQGGFYPYRCSKAALNAATKSMSIDLKKDEIIAACLHPGWVRTDMGGKSAPLDIETSVSGMFTTMEAIGERDTGKFLQYDGTELLW